MHSGAGLYKRGRFYFEIVDGLWFDDSVLASGLPVDDIPATARLVSFLHESAHYVQDMGLGACIDRDLLLDRSAAYLFRWLRDATSRGAISCPVPPSQSHQDGIWSHDLDKAIEFRTYALTERRAVTTMQRIPDGDASCEEPVGLTTRHLLEATAVVKTLLQVARRAEQESELRYLQEIRDDICVMPEALGDDYARALGIFDSIVGRLMIGDDVFKPRNWPYDAAPSSPRLAADMGFLLVADAALHTPPRDFIGSLVAKGKAEWDDYSPPHRFVRAMWALHRNGGFPDATQGSGEAFVRELYDWLAERLGWLGWAETNGAWEHVLTQLRDVERGAISDGYRVRFLRQRKSNPYGLLFKEADDPCGRSGAPIVYLNDHGLMHYLCLGNVRMPLAEPNGFAWDAMQVQPVRWRNASGSEDFTESGTRAIVEWPTFRQEIVFRSMCRAFEDAVLEGTSLRCPWGSNGCRAASTDCRTIRRADSIPETQCALRQYALGAGIHLDRLSWTKSDG